ncbi:MAG: hypothetical protein OIN89_06945 [Candidatus Methanoperedens sp.]|jgi:hypothetical protein|nr:hypothetical protein [Candidatus Methanoperedens sp.]PKL53648.1 MAG: hypothetical protein CVV36_06010 [Candidatus Methanoperedenaceae archaeon HGW-Methanoperedenaceae-1]
MRKEVYALLIIAAVMVVIVSYQPEARKSIFTETMGDMSLAMYDTGEVAAMQIQGIYGLRDIPLTKGYTAAYSGRNGSMRIMVVESGDHNSANDAFNAMNSMFGASTGHEEHEGDAGQAGQTGAHSNDAGEGHNFTAPVKVNIFDFQKPDVFSMQANNLYMYYYLKMDYKRGKVYWLTFDYPDTDYQKAMVRQAIMKI